MAWQARPRGCSQQKGRFIQGINQLKAAGLEKVVCLAARAALSFTAARRAQSLIYGRLQVIKERKRFQGEITRQLLFVSFFGHFNVLFSSFVGVHDVIICKKHGSLGGV